MRAYELLPGESEIMTIRRFPKFVVYVFLQFLLSAILPLLLIIMVLWFVDHLEAPDQIFRVTIGFYLIYLIFLIQFSYIDWLNDELDLLIITNKRIICFIQESFFKRHSSIASLKQVQDAEGKTEGLIDSFLGIGTLSIQTAADKIQFIMQDVKNPDKVVGILNREIYNFKQSEIKERWREDIVSGDKIDDSLKELLNNTKERIMKLWS